MVAPGPKPTPVHERVLRRVELVEPSGCLLWTGAVNRDGYGRVGTSPRGWMQAHHATWVAVYGPVPEGHVLDHTCHKPRFCAGGRSCWHRRCVNHEHLEPVTVGENSWRGQRGVFWRAYRVERQRQEDELAAASYGYATEAADLIERGMFPRLITYTDWCHQQKRRDPVA